jgi:anti-sigma regulatory factor (Ser/Thr protein kinase)
VTIAAGHRAACSFQHEAFIYDSDEDYLATLVPLIEAAHVAGDTVLAVVPRHNAARLRPALGDVAGATEFVDAATWYEHPIATIAAYDAILRRIPVGTRAFVVGEVEFGTSDADRTSWTRYESALNTALHRHDARVVCPYDARVLPARIVEDARRTHPYLLTATEVRGSDRYLDAPTLFPLLPPTVAVPAATPDVDLLVDVRLGSARRAFAAVATDAGFDAESTDDLTLAVNELLTNAVTHGGGAARLRVWTSGADLTCVVEDAGSGVDDPLIGYAGPPPGSLRGYGAWLARRLFDHSEFLRSPTGGLSVLVACRAEPGRTGHGPSRQPRSARPELGERR